MKEIDLVKNPRPMLVNTIDALKGGDVPAARAAFEAYDAAWNGIEVYVSFRSRALYSELEAGYQKKIEELLDAPRPNLAEIVPLLESMLAKYDEAIKLAETGPAISPLFDDVAAIRIARAGLRATGPALKAGDLAKAKSFFSAFQQQWGGVEDLIKLRSPDTYREIEDAMARVDRAFQQDKPTADELMPLVAALTERYNSGLNLVVTAARNASPG